MSNKFEVTNNKSGFIGNFYNKYESKNIFEKYIINQYFETILKICKNNSINNFIDVGCGEGKWLFEFSKKNFKCIGTDHSDEVITLAKRNLNTLNIDIFKSDIYHDNFSEIINSKINETGINNIFFLEVLEHLKNPENIMDKFRKINFDNMIITVPNEPLWRFMNCCRLKYINQLGNTPGPIHHFSLRKFKKLLSKKFKIIEIKLPVPFLILLIRNV